jgi:hypothetical protein
MYKVIFYILLLGIVIPHNSFAITTSLLIGGGTSLSFEDAVDLEADGSIAADSVALGTDTTGNYAAGDSEGGAATHGDSATEFSVRVHLRQIGYLLHQQKKYLLGQYPLKLLHLKV